MTESVVATDQTVYLATPAGSQRLTLRYLPDRRLYQIINQRGVVLGYHDESSYARYRALFCATPEEALARAAARAKEATECGNR